MAQPVVHDTQPCTLTLEAGTHWWCSCGLSGHQPLCDGSHKGTGLAPVKIVLTAPTVLCLCNCKHTATAPYCDGTHLRLQQAQTTP